PRAFSLCQKTHTHTHTHTHHVVRRSHRPHGRVRRHNKLGQRTLLGRRRQPLPSPENNSASSSPLILYKPPTVWGLVRGAAINLVLPFINGMMLGFGELFAHEAAYRLGWGGTKVFPLSRRQAHAIGPGIEIRDKPARPIPDLHDMTSLE
ncbi:mitochondrial outer membrane protein, partial [Apiospora arundinis]